MEEQLIALGFKKVHPDKVDKAYFYWQQNYKHDFFTGLHVIVGESIIVYCREPKHKINGKSASLSSDDFVVSYFKKTKENLFKVDQWLKKN